MAVVVFGHAFRIGCIGAQPCDGDTEEKEVEESQCHRYFLVGVAAAARFDGKVECGDGNGDEEPEEKDDDKQEDETIVPQRGNDGGDEERGYEFEVFHRARA